MRRAALQLYERADVLSVDENRPLSDYTRSKILSCIGPVWPRETAPGVVLQPGPATGMKVHEQVEIRVNSGVLVGAEKGVRPCRRGERKYDLCLRLGGKLNGPVTKKR